MKNKELIDLIKSRFELQTDTQLAYVIGVAPTIVASWKMERSPIPVYIKFRLLDHLECSVDVPKIASFFVDLNAHKAMMQLDLDRVDDLKKKRNGEVGNFINIKQIERVNELQHNQDLSDEQMADLLGITPEKLTKIKEGKAELSAASQAGLQTRLAANKVENFVIKNVPFVDESTKTTMKEIQNSVRQKNINKRLANNVDTKTE